MGKRGVANFASDLIVYFVSILSVKLNLVLRFFLLFLLSSYFLRFLFSLALSQWAITFLTTQQCIFHRSYDFFLWSLLACLWLIFIFIASIVHDTVALHSVPLVLVTSRFKHPSIPCTVKDVSFVLFSTFFFQFWYHGAGPRCSSNVTMRCMNCSSFALLSFVVPTGKLFLRSNRKVAEQDNGPCMFLRVQSTEYDKIPLYFLLWANECTTLLSYQGFRFHCAVRHEPSNSHSQTKKTRKKVVFPSRRITPYCWRNFSTINYAVREVN